MDMWKDTLLDAVEPDVPEEFPFFVFGNKKDLVQKNPVKRAVAKEVVQEWIQGQRSKPMLYEETSALDGGNINHVFNKLAQSLLKESIEKAMKTHQD